MKPNIDDKLFVTKWLEAAENNRGQGWIAQELKVSRQAISQRAQKLRKHGVKLPGLIHVAEKYVVDVVALNDLINSRVER